MGPVTCHPAAVSWVPISKVPYRSTFSNRWARFLFQKFLRTLSISLSLFLSCAFRRTRVLLSILFVRLLRYIHRQSMIDRLRRCSLFFLWKKWSKKFTFYRWVWNFETNCPFFRLNINKVFICCASLYLRIERLRNVDINKLNLPTKSRSLYGIIIYIPMSHTHCFSCFAISFISWFLIFSLWILNDFFSSFAWMQNVIWR